MCAHDLKVLNAYEKELRQTKVDIVSQSELTYKAIIGRLFFAAEYRGEKYLTQLHSAIRDVEAFYNDITSEELKEALGTVDRAPQDVNFDVTKFTKIVKNIYALSRAEAAFKGKDEELKNRIQHTQAFEALRAQTVKLLKKDGNEKPSSKVLVTIAEAVFGTAQQYLNKQYEMFKAQIAEYKRKTKEEIGLLTHFNKSQPFTTDELMKVFIGQLWPPQQMKVFISWGVDDTLSLAMNLERVYINLLHFAHELGYIEDFKKLNPPA